MDNPRDLIVQDVRCFQGEQQGSLRPITLLVGENSTGKTTFLGCYRILHRVFSWPYMDDRLDFNEEPFSMGSFRDIVRSRRGPGGRVDEFKLGLKMEPAQDSGMALHTLLATFRERGSQPVIASLRFEFDADAFLELRRTDDGTDVAIPSRVTSTQVPFGEAMFVLDFLVFSTEGGGPSPHEIEPLEPVADYLRGLLSRRPTTAGGRRRTKRRIAWRPSLPEMIPVAPLRSKPRRTYDPVRETASPEGEHIPMLMMRLNRTNKDHWTSLHDHLVEFGRGSGLFSDIKVKRHGGQMSDPFQLQVKVRSGPHANIMDVGYGVSQSLPILVDVMAAEESGRARQGRRPSAGRSFLLQQPEVHLHPRGQAELASLFVEAFRKHGSRFLIETHSDYIVDRIRISVRKQMLKPDDVSILYFEPAGNAVKIHNMTLDRDGNLQDAPAEYRDFFVRETDQLLGFVD
jgi:hypothetical protein